MAKFIMRYVGLMGITVFLFVNFIACGAQMYQVSMEDDVSSGQQLSAETKDPKSAVFGIHSPMGWKQLPIRFRVGKKINEVQKQGLISAMEIWETVVGKKLFVYKGKDIKDGDSFKDLYSSLDDSINGNYLDTDWRKTGKSEMVLATTIWNNYDPDTIATADIRFNNAYYSIQDSLAEGLELTSTGDKEVVDMESLSLHELGHLLGLSHVDAEHDKFSIMNPSLYIGPGLASRKLSRGDIERIQRIYGCEGAACDIDELLISLEQNEMKEDIETESYGDNQGSIENRTNESTEAH